LTLIERLGGSSIIGLLATLGMIALNNARVKARDADRMASMTQLHKAMEFCADAQGGSYSSPANCCGTYGAGTNVKDCGALLTTYIPNLVIFKDPSNPTADCDGTNGTTCEYRFAAQPAASGYTVYFHLEGSGGLNKTLTKFGIQ
jgi:hypothetical protein